MSPSHPFRVLIHRDEILRRIHELAREVRADFGDEPPLLVAVIEGARTFARHLQQSLALPVVVHEIRASSYGAGTTSSGLVALGPSDGLDVAGRRLVLIEDIVDTGRTIAALRELFLARGAVECRVASLLSKPSRRVVEVDIDYLGFEIPDEFVIGFGMDFAGRYREIGEVVVYDEGQAAAYGT
ncbi:MAG: phosphoribosyltransferase [Planctomycetota bacterium]